MATSTIAATCAHLSGERLHSAAPARAARARAVWTPPSSRASRMAPRARSARRRAPPAVGPRGAAPAPRRRAAGHVLDAGVGPNQTELAQGVGGALGGHRAEVGASCGGVIASSTATRFARALRERGDGLLRLHGAHRRRGDGGGHRVNTRRRFVGPCGRRRGGGAGGERLRGDAGGHTAQRARGALGRGGARLQAAAAEREHPRIGGVGVAPAVLPPSLAPSLFTRTRRTRSTPASSTYVSSVHSPRSDACPSRRRRLRWW